MKKVMHLHDYRAKKDPVTIMVQQVSNSKNPQFEVDSQYFGKMKMRLNDAPEKMTKYLNNLKSYVIVVNESIQSHVLCEAFHNAHLHHSEVHEELFQGLTDGTYKAALEHMKGSQ